MESILQFFDLNQGNSSRKLLAHKRQVDGNEAPRNSLEFSSETSVSCDLIYQDIPYSCQVKQQSSKMIDRSNKIPMKTFIDEEMPKRIKSNTPSIVARLMGMDALPTETIPAIDENERRNEKVFNGLPKRETTKSCSLHGLSSTRKAKQDSCPFGIKKENPQEELLHKFKRDFEAWQTSKTDNYYQKAKVNRMHAQENPNKDSRRYPTYMKTSKEILPPQQTCINKYSVMAKFNEKQNKSSSHTRIVILRPNEGDEGFWSNSPEFSEKEANMQEFLEEVKERLKSEILGKSKSNTIARDFRAEPGETKQISYHISKQIRESDTRDMRGSLVRSESTKSYKSQFPESVDGYTRKILTERFKNVITNKTEPQISLDAAGRSKTMQESVNLRTMRDFSKPVKKSGHCEDKKPSVDSEVIKCEQMDEVFDAEPVAPTRLARSFSSPILTGAHIRHNHEESEHLWSELRSKGKDGFNLKGTVSTFRQNFTLKGKFFGKKTHSVAESDSNKFDSLKAHVAVPSKSAKVGNVEENPTEVPPSPVSLSGSSLDELCRLGVPSPVSPLQARFIEEQSADKVCIESSSIFSEPRTFSQLVEHNASKQVTADESYNKASLEVEGHAQAYIRDILVTAGIFDYEVFNENFPICGTSRNLIPKWVFDKINEDYRQRGKLDDTESRKLLFDLTNEALPRILKPATSCMKSVQWPDTVLHGKTLSDCLWAQIEKHIIPTPNEKNSADQIAARDVRVDPWCNILHEDVYVIGNGLELVILEDLIDEFMLEMSA